MSGSMLEAILNFVCSGAGAALAIWLLRGFLKSYVDEKGKNLATREDIASITHEVERVRLGYNELLEQMKARHQLRLAALDKRLAVHQRAFVLWRQVYTAEPSDVEAVVEKSRAWWNRNCLYLEPKVRQAFLDAITQERRNRALLASSRDRMGMGLFPDDMEKAFAFPNLLFEAIQLPPLTEVEAAALRAPESVKDSRTDG